MIITCVACRHILVQCAWNLAGSNRPRSTNHDPAMTSTSPANENWPYTPLTESSNGGRGCAGFPRSPVKIANVSNTSHSHNRPAAEKGRVEVLCNQQGHSSQIHERLRLITCPTTSANDKYDLCCENGGVFNEMHEGTAQKVSYFPSLSWLTYRFWT